MTGWSQATGAAVKAYRWHFRHLLGLLVNLAGLMILLRQAMATML